MTLPLQLILTAARTAVFMACLMFALPALAETNATEIPDSGSEIITPVIGPEQEVELTDQVVSDMIRSNATAVENIGLQDSYFSEQKNADAEFSWGNYFFVVGFMFLFLGILWFAVWSLKKRNAVPGASLFAPNAFKLEASLPLGGRRALVLVRFLNHRYLLGVTDQQINLIKELTGTDEVQAPIPSKNGAFAALMKKVSQKNDNQHADK